MYLTHTVQCTCESKFVTPDSEWVTSHTQLEEQDEGDSPVFNGIREYLLVYKNFSENLTMVLKLVLMEDMTKEGMTEADSMIETLLMQVPQ